METKNYMTQNERIALQLPRFSSAIAGGDCA